MKKYDSEFGLFYGSEKYIIPCYLRFYLLNCKKQYKIIKIKFYF
jgi:hypothetical protein